MTGMELVVAACVLGAVVFALMPGVTGEAGGRRRPDTAPGALRGPMAAGLHPRRRRDTLPAGFERHGSLLFAERAGPRLIFLDCMLGGAPVRLTARCGMAWWAADRFTRLVERWCREDPAAQVAVVVRAGGLRAIVSRGETSLTLDVVHPGELASDMGERARAGGLRG